MRISDWSSDVCSSDLRVGQGGQAVRQERRGRQSMMDKALRDRLIDDPAISPIVGTRVYWIHRPQSASVLPAIVLPTVSPARTYTTKGEPTLPGTSVQFDLSGLAYRDIRPLYEELMADRKSTRI